GTREKRTREQHLNGFHGGSFFCGGFTRVFTGQLPRGRVILCNNKCHYRHPLVLLTVPMYQQVINQVAKRRLKRLKGGMDNSIRNLETAERVVRIERFRL